MDRIERRRYQILQRIAAAGRFISSAEIASALKISAKTVRWDIAALSEQMRQYGIHIQKKTGQGYCMDPVSAARFQRMGAKGMEADRVPVKNQRIHYLTQRLLATDSYVKSADLADELFVSQTIISAELQSVRKFLDGYGLRIESVPGYGLQIQGAEQYIRSCMIHEFAHSRLETDTLYTVDGFNAMFRMDAGVYERICRAVEDVLANPEKKPYFISKSHMSRIALAICLAVNRSGRPMHFSNKEIYESKVLRSYQAACDVLRLVSDFLGTDFSEPDRIYLANLILGYRTFLRYDEVAVKENFYRAMNFANEAIMQLFSRYGVKEFVYDRELKERVALYLLPMEARMVTHMLLEDIISREMSRNFILAREFAIYVGALLEKNYRCVLHHSEIDRLAMVFLPSIPKIRSNVRQGCTVAVISQEYSRDIAMSIAQRYLNCCEGLARQVIAYESYQIQDVVNSKCDLLLTDIPAEVFAGFPGDILYYSFSLSTEDQATLMNWYHGKETVWSQLKTFFHPSLYFQNCSAASKSDVIKLVAERLLAAGYADVSICADLNRNSRRRFTVTNNGIGFVKTLYTYGEWSFCAIFQFQKPAVWEGILLQTLFVLSTGSADPSDFLLFNGWMEALLKDENCPLSAKGALPYDQLMEFLHDYYMRH